MAKKMKRTLALVLALALCAGQIAVPAMAEEAAPEVTPEIIVEVSVPQAPEAGSGMDVTISEPATTITNNDGITQEATSTITDWNGTEAGAAVTGTETVTEVTGTDDITGQTLYEGETITGSETSITTEVTTETTEKDIVISDVTNPTGSEEKGTPETTTENITNTETTEGEWIEGELVEGEAKIDEALSGETETSTEVEIEFEAPGEVTLELTPGKAPTTVTETIAVEDVISGLITLPENGYTEITDENGIVIGYEITTESETNDTNVTVNTPESTTGNYTETAPVTLSENVKAGKEDVLAEDGTVIGQIVTEVTPEYDADGNIIKYTITKTTTVDIDEKKVEDATAPSTGEKQSETTIRLPEKPAGSVATDEATGITTTVTVEDILDENGNVTGYAIITENTDENGNLISTNTEKKFGTVVTTNITTVTDPTTIETITKAQEVTTETTEITAESAIQETDTVTTRLNEFVNTQMTQTDYAYVEIDGKLYFLYTGSMTVSEGAEHGDTSLMDPITPMGSLMNKNDSLDLAQGGGNAVNNTGAPEEGFKYVGYGVNTSLNVGKGNSYSDVVQFRLKSADGKEYYAMCIDLSTTIRAGHLYDIADITSEDYYQQSGSVDVQTAEKIRSVALNGYWGTAEDVGSMDDVKAFLREYLQGQNLSEDKINSILNSLTPGQASAATQAALWKFGNKNAANAVNENNLIYNGNAADETNAKYLYNALLAAANDPNAQLEADEGVEFLDAEDITAGEITVKSKVVSNDAGHANNDANPDNDIYNTDIGFTLGIEPSKLNGDLIVTVNVGGNEVKKVRLAGADDPLLPLGRIVKNDDGSYTIPDVEIAEGITVTLNLSGTQDLGTGVYIYTSLEGNFNSSQTLVTLASGERKVDLNMNMQLNVEEPNATATKTEGSATTVTKTVDTRVDVKADKEVKTETETKTTYVSDFVSTGTVRKKANAKVTTTKEVIEETKEEKSWFSSWLQFFAPDPVPLNDDFPIPEGGRRRTADDIILDEEVPLAAAPKTGDISALWAAISMISLGGMAVLSKKREEI